MRDESFNIFNSGQVWQKIEWNFGYGPEYENERKEALGIIILETNIANQEVNQDIADW